MIRTAMIENGVVTNVTMHDPESDWTAPDGAILVASESAGIGDTWDGETFAKPPPTREQAAAAIRAKLSEIDARSIRPLRAILDAQATGRAPDPADMAILVNLKAEADALRASLAT